MPSGKVQARHAQGNPVSSLTQRVIQEQRLRPGWLPKAKAWVRGDVSTLGRHQRPEVV